MPRRPNKPRPEPELGRQPPLVLGHHDVRLPHIVGRKRQVPARAKPPHEGEKQRHPPRHQPAAVGRVVHPRAHQPRRLAPHDHPHPRRPPHQLREIARMVVVVMRQYEVANLRRINAQPRHPPLPLPEVPAVARVDLHPRPAPLHQIRRGDSLPNRLDAIARPCCHAAMLSHVPPSVPPQKQSTSPPAALRCRRRTPSRPRRARAGSGSPLQFLPACPTHAATGRCGISATIPRARAGWALVPRPRVARRCGDGGTSRRFVRSASMRLTKSTRSSRRLQSTVLFSQ